MKTDHLISIDEFCTYYKVEISFIDSLEEFGLLEIIIEVEKSQFIHINYLQQLEKIIRLHYELDINLEGIEAITHLLFRIKNMQNKITALENRLRLHESIE